MDLKGSRTEKNLWEAIAGESKARTKYTFFSSQAKKDGFVQISKIFEDTSNNEKEHAKIWFKLLHNDAIPSTKENLKDCIENENYEYTKMYPEFARVAREEGFYDIAKLFDGVAEIEKFHKERFEKLLSNLENNSVFNKIEPVIWECSNCGFSVECKDAPEKCPVCSHKKEYFFIKEQNY